MPPAASRVILPSATRTRLVTVAVEFLELGTKSLTTRVDSTVTRCLLPEGNATSPTATVTS